jgi:hypothetical protein
MVTVTVYTPLQMLYADKNKLDDNPHLGKKKKRDIRKTKIHARHIGSCL